nr:rhodanese-like domain-containing protein [Hanstruepera flava]
MRNLIIITFLCFSYVSNAQESLADVLKKHNTHVVPYMSVQELAMPKTKAIILDARETQEYNVSHIKDAIHVGYNAFSIENIEALMPNKNEQIVVYCSLGIRSEDIAEQLQKLGYTNVYNLYGGIFEWKNNNFPVYNKQGKTNKIHGFSKEWSKWLTKGECVYE